MTEHDERAPGALVDARANGPAVGLAMALVLALAVTLGAAMTPGGTTSAPAAARVVAAASAPDNYTPAPGVKFNNPLNENSHVIARHIRRSINSAPSGTRMRLATWNLQSDLFVNALAKAHQRGVSVRVIMSYGVANRQGPDGSYQTLKAILSKGNANRRADMTSWLRTCRNSCRGSEGIQHAKFYLFQRAGKASQVVMSTSANLTEVAANRQWNDMFTTVGRTRSYNQYLKIFNQMAQDQPRSTPFYTFADGDLTGWFHPGGTHNLPMAMLNKVRCLGARNGVNGKTVIRIAQAIFNGSKGAQIAKKLRDLHAAGCNVKIVYTALGRESAQYLSDIRKQRILQDLDGDGFHDRYLHIKAMAIHGHYGDNRSARVVLQGSANWSGMGWLADEQGYIIRRGSAEKAYVKRVDSLWANPPENPYPRTTARRSAQVDNPFKYVDFD